MTILPVLFEGLAIFTTIPLLIAAAIFLKWRKPGRVPAKDTCVGMGQKPFARYRFHCASQPPEHQFHIKGIQALPQLWNVIKGDMSLVGPCPVGLAKADDIARVLPLFDERFTVRPGMTGWARINGGLRRFASADHPADVRVRPVLSETPDAAAGHRHCGTGRPVPDIGKPKRRQRFLISSPVAR